MKVTIIIPNYNGKHFMEPCLDSLKTQTFKDFHILVVDNHSTDGSLEYMAEHHPDIEVIALKENYGFSTAVNTGIRHAKSMGSDGCEGCSLEESFEIPFRKT